MNDNTTPIELKTNYLLDNVNFHGLRHTSTSMLISEGLAITTVSKRLGHPPTPTTTTTDIYSHLFENTVLKQLLSLKIF